jgi:AbrB family looped-hinge helix DNA binding protein
MHTAKLKTNGQITIPAKVRKALTLNSGDRVEFVLVAPGRYELVAVNRDVTELKAMFGPASKLVSIEAMRATITRRGLAA